MYMNSFSSPSPLTLHLKIPGKIKKNVHPFYTNAIVFADEGTMRQHALPRGAFKGRAFLFACFIVVLVAGLNFAVLFSRIRLGGGPKTATPSEPYRSFLHRAPFKAGVVVEEKEVINGSWSSFEFDDVCYAIGSGHCVDAHITLSHPNPSKGRLVVGGGTQLFRFEKSQNGVKMRLCDQPEYYITTRKEGLYCYFVVTEGADEAVELTVTADYYLKGYVIIEIAPGHMMGGYQGKVRVEDEDGDKRVSLRRDVSWKMVAKGESVKNIDSRLATYVSFKSAKYEVDAKGYAEVITPDGKPCDKAFHGCCNPKPRSFRTIPKWKGAGNIALLVVSSLFTFAKRRAMLEKWVFDEMFSSISITLDCKGDVDRPWEAQEGHDTHITWLLGPQGVPPPRYSEVTVRVLMAAHWVFANKPFSYTFMVDDDTLVLPRSLKWVLSGLPDPSENLLYVGHTSEWYEKTVYHGDMAFGGGGSLFSSALTKRWNGHWGGLGDGTQNRSAIETMLKSGECSHSGGDGAVCRCMVAAGRSEETFIDWPGFHQLDIVGTKEMLKILKKTCSDCPSMADQTLPWVLDSISQQPVVTIHHLLATEPNSIIPGTSAERAAHILFDSEKKHPGLLPFRRKCGSVGKYTVCINFGLTVQIFANLINEFAAKYLIRTFDKQVGVDVPFSSLSIKNKSEDTAFRTLYHPIAKLDRLRILETPKKHLLCCLFYTPSPSSAQYSPYHGSTRPTYCEASCPTDATASVTFSSQWEMKMVVCKKLV